MNHQQKVSTLRAAAGGKPAETNYFQPVYRGRNWSVILVFLAAVPIPLGVACLMLL